MARELPRHSRSDPISRHFTFLLPSTVWHLSSPDAVVPASATDSERTGSWQPSPQRTPHQRGRDSYVLPFTRHDAGRDKMHHNPRVHRQLTHSAARTRALVSRRGRQSFVSLCLYAIWDTHVSLSPHHFLTAAAILPFCRSAILHSRAFVPYMSAYVARRCAIQYKLSLVE